MARYVLPVVGAVVGFIYGGPQGAMWGWSLGAAVGGAVDPQVIKGPSIGDLAQQTSQEGVPRPIVFGTSVPMAGNIIASAEPRIVRRTQGGKGGPKVKTESVFRTYAIRICEGPITTVLRVWRNNELVYDARPGSGFSAENTEFLGVARFFLGTFTQNPSPDLEAAFGVGTTPAHRGTAYMVMANEDLTDLRGAIPQFQFQIYNGTMFPGAEVNLTNHTIVATRATAFASVRVTFAASALPGVLNLATAPAPLNTGLIDGVSTTDVLEANEWAFAASQNSGILNRFDVRFQPVSGPAPTLTGGAGAVTDWQPLNSATFSLTYSHTNSAPGTTTNGVWRFQIRDASSLQILVTGDITWSAINP